MTFDQAMEMARSPGVLVTRRSWEISCGIRPDEEGSIFYWKLDNCDGLPSGNGWPYEPADEDRAATDWNALGRPRRRNWIELDFE